MLPSTRVAIKLFMHVSFWLSFCVHDALQVNAVGLVDKTCLSVPECLPLSQTHTKKLAVSETEGSCLCAMLFNQSVTYQIAF